MCVFVCVCVIVYTETGIKLGRELHVTCAVCVQYVSHSTTEVCCQGPPSGVGTCVCVCVCEGACV